MPVVPVSSAAHLKAPLDTRPAAEVSEGVEVRPCQVSNLANVSLEIASADNAGSQKLQVTAITCHSVKWKLKAFGQQKPGDILELWPGESLRTMVQCYSVPPTLASKSESSFSVINFGGQDNDLLRGESWRKNCSRFALRQQSDVPLLTADAQAPSPAADLAPAPLHSALTQYNNLRQVTDLDAVISVHWRYCPKDPTIANNIETVGQHCAVLCRIGDSVVIPVTTPNTCDDTALMSLPSALLSGEEPKPPVKIIPTDPVELPQIPLDFAKSVGIDLNAESAMVLRVRIIQ